MVKFVVVVVETTKFDTLRAPEVPLTTPNKLSDSTGILLSLKWIGRRNPGFISNREDKFTVE